MNFQFTDVRSRKELSQAIDFLHKQSLGYPNYDDWVQKTESELDAGYKSAILAFSGGQIVGDLVYQKHKENPRMLEIKNLRVHQDLRERNFARFMIRQMEVDNLDDYDAVIADAPAGLSGVIGFMTDCGYTPILSRPLYDGHTTDVVMIKPLRGSKKVIVPRALELF